MAEFFTVITDAGREAVARATQAGEKVNITHFAVGDGGGVPVTPNEEQTQLVNECWRGLVATYSQQGDSLIIDTYIPADEESFTVREMGVFTADGVLFAVCNTPEMRKVLPSEGAVGNFTLGMELDVTNIDMKYIEIHTNPMLDFIKNSEKGQPNGVAELDEHGNLKQLPDLNFDTAGSAAVVQNNLNAHINNKQNPHGVTAALVNAVPINNKATDVEATTGTNDIKYMTPLKTSQSILSKKATLQETQAGTIDNKWVSPYALENSIKLRSPNLTLLESKSISTSNAYRTFLESNLRSSDFVKYHNILVKIKITNIGIANTLILESVTSSRAEIFKCDLKATGAIEYESHFYLRNIEEQSSGDYKIQYYSENDLNFIFEIMDIAGYVRLCMARTSEEAGVNFKIDWKIYGVENSF